MMTAGVAISGLAGCSTLMPSASKQASTTFYCEAYQPVLWSKADTDDTIRQTKANNAVYKTICP